MKYKAIIFDLDGTIVDTDRIWKQTNQILIESRGICYTPELRTELDSRTHGLTFQKSCIAIKELANLKESPEDLAREGRLIAISLYKQGIVYIKGFKEFHKAICTFNLDKAIATNADDHTIRLTDEILNLRQFFGKHIYGVSAVNYTPKPDPALYMHAAKELGYKPELCIAIEDSAFGVQAAKGAGMYCIGINTGGNPLALKKADAIINCYTEINIKKILSQV